ncbi:hypothetical protein EBESD8_55290 [Rhodococcus aetherivorans]|nr:hypothetical protein EBESD8_55290 [Rhodococcus aetherivorans]
MTAFTVGPQWHPLTCMPAHYSHPYVCCGTLGTCSVSQWHPKLFPSSVTSPN